MYQGLEPRENQGLVKASLRDRSHRGLRDGIAGGRQSGVYLVKTFTRSPKGVKAVDYLDVSSEEMSQTVSVLSPLPLTPPVLRHLWSRLRWLPAGLRYASGALLDGTAEHTKAKVEAPFLRRAPVAARRSAVPGVEVPAAAPEHPVRARRRAGWIRRRTARILAVPILAPLPDVTVHVVQAPGIRLLLANRVGF